VPPGGSRTCTRSAVGNHKHGEGSKSGEALFVAVDVGLSSVAVIRKVSTTAVKALPLALPLWSALFRRPNLAKERVVEMRQRPKWFERLV
jgi:hypothetical protein